MTLTTSAEISFGVGYILAIKQDSSPSISNLQSFSKVADLRTDNATNRPYATYEPDFWLLDGEYKFLPGDEDYPGEESVHIGIMNLTQSNGSGVFSSPPVLTITLAQVYDITGLTLRFAQYSDDYPDSLRIEFFDAGDVQIGNDHDCTPDSWQYIFEVEDELPIEDVKKIVITFNSTNKPYRYLRMTGIDYGEMMYFTGSQVKEAKVIEETDPLSVEVRSNTFDVTLYSADGEFSPINPGGSYYSLIERQPISVSERVGNSSRFIGQFYLDKWSNKSDTQIEFQCVDIVAILDTMTYLGGIWLGAGIDVEELLDDILTPIHVPFDLDASLYGTTITGWIPICTYREALQQIAFAIGAYIDTSRDRPLKIYPMKLASEDYEIVVTKAMKGIEQTVSLKPIVTGVRITAHNIVYGGGTIDLYNDTLAAGIHEIRFKQPCHYLTVTGATITSSGANYAILNVAAPGTVTLNGKVYTDTRKIYSVNNESLPAGVLPNIIEIEEASLVNSSNAAAIAQRVYDYYQQRLIQKLKMYASDIHDGNVLLIDSLHGKQIRGIVEKMESDLAFGMVQQVEVVGVVE